MDQRDLKFVRWFLNGVRLCLDWWNFNRLVLLVRGSVSRDGLRIILGRGLVGVKVFRFRCRAVVLGVVGWEVRGIVLIKWLLVRRADVSREGNVDGNGNR